MQEELQRWRELNTAEHFIQAAGILNGISQSFPLLIHHKVGSQISHLYRA
jgi:hypothetical protein